LLSVLHIEVVNATSSNKSLIEQIDTTTSGGKLIFHIFGALAEFERDIIRERTQAGLAATRTRGKRGGRRPNLKPQNIAMVRKLYEDKQTPIEDICRMFKISRMTLWRYVKKAGDKLQQQN
jgi:DNA invertase Pin-like site-specific DNA recombinase